VLSLHIRCNRIKETDLEICSSRCRGSVTRDKQNVKKQGHRPALAEEE